MISYALTWGNLHIRQQASPKLPVLSLHCKAVFLEDMDARPQESLLTATGGRHLSTPNTHTRSNLWASTWPIIKLITAHAQVTVQPSRCMVVLCPCQDLLHPVRCADLSSSIRVSSVGSASAMLEIRQFVGAALLTAGHQSRRCCYWKDLQGGVSLRFHSSIRVSKPEFEGL